MNRVDRYLMRELVGPTALGLTVYTFMFLVNTFFDIAQMIVHRGVPGNIVFRMLMLSLPNVLFYTLPMAALLGALMAFGRLQADGEITALRAAGLTTGRLLRAPLLFGLALGGAAWWMGDSLLPQARAELALVQRDALRSSNLLGMVQEKVFFDLVPGMVLYVERVDPDNKDLIHLFLYQREAEGISVTVAESGRLLLAEDQDTLVFSLRDGATLHFPGNDKTNLQQARFETQTLHTANPYASSWRRTQSSAFRASLRELNFTDLVGRIRENASMPFKGKERALLLNPVILEATRRITLPFAVPLFVLIGVPLAMGRVRTSRSTGFALSVGIILLYWTLESMLADLSVDNRVNPWVAGFLPTALFLVWALYLVSRQNRGEETRLGAALAWGWYRLRRILDRALPRRQHRTVEGLDHLEEAWIEDAARSGFPRRMDHHVTRIWLKVYGLVLVSILLLHYIIDLRGLSEHLAAGHTGMDSFVLYILSGLPGRFTEFAGLCTLTSTLVTFGLLARTSELTAYKAAGVSVYRLAYPIFLLVLLLTFSVFALENWVTPFTNRQADELRNAIKGRNEALVQSADGSWSLQPSTHTVMHYDYFNRTSQTLHGVTEYRIKQNPFRLAQVVHGAQAEWRGDNWVLQGAWTRDLDADGAFSETGALTLSGLEAPSRYWTDRILAAERTSFAELRRSIVSMSQRGYGVVPLRVAYHRKWTQIFLSLVMLTVALPFSFSLGRRGSLSGVGLALVVFLVYYILMAVFSAMGEAQFLPPALSAWAASLIFSAAGFYQFLNVRT